MIKLIEKFIPLSDLLKIALTKSWGREFKVKKGEIIFEEGEVCNFMYYIV